MKAIALAGILALLLSSCAMAIRPLDPGCDYAGEQQRLPAKCWPEWLLPKGVI